MIGSRFRHVLNFLRNGTLHLSEDPCVGLAAARELLEEAHFFQLEELATALEHLIQQYQRKQITQEHTHQTVLNALLRRQRKRGRPTGPDVHRGTGEPLDTAVQALQPEFRLDADF